MSPPPSGSSQETTQTIPFARAHSPTWRKRLSTIGPLVVGLLLVIAMVRVIGWDSLIENLKQADFFFAFLVFLLLVISNILAGIRWHFAVHYLFDLKANAFVNAWLAIKLFIESSALACIVPGAQASGDMWRTVGLSRAILKTEHQSHWLVVLSSVAWDRVIGLWSIFVVSLIANLFVAAQPINASPLVQHSFNMIVWFEIIAVIGFPMFIAILPRLPHRIKTLKPLQIWVAMHYRLRQHGWRLLLIVVLSLIVLFMSAIGWGLVIKSIVPETPLIIGIATAAPIFLAASLPVSMGGWGTREIAAVQMLSAYNISQVDAISASILLGGIYTLYAVVVSPLFLVRARHKGHTPT